VIYLDRAFSQIFALDALPAAIRATLGKPLRRAAALTQLAVVGAFAALPESARAEPCALLWQSTSGPRPETLTLLDEMCDGAGEPMPYDFLATQPAIAAAQLQPLLPGLCSATHLPLASDTNADWHLLLALAATWLTEGRYSRILCAQLDHWGEQASGHWLSLTANHLESSQASLQVASQAVDNAHQDHPDFPIALAHWLEAGKLPTLTLRSPAQPSLAVEFARL